MISTRGAPGGGFSCNMPSKNLSAVLVVADSQRQRSDRLIEHCRRLDGTELIALEGDEGTRAPYPQCNTNAFHQACAAMKGRPFLWIETDSIPIAPGWLKAIERDYELAGKPILAPYLDNPPFDAASGICVYPPDSHWLFPKRYPSNAWDLWMEGHLQPLISRTNLIQHAYGRYDQRGNSEPFRFPKDNDILRPGAVLFHRDRFQELIGRKPAATIRYLHHGDLGDIVAALPSIRGIGKGNLILSDCGTGRRESLKGERFNLIRPLLEVQPYISGVKWEDHPQDITHDFTDFRALPHQKGETLAHWQARLVGATISLDPWLTVSEPERHGKIVIARSGRYHNRDFPWHQIIRKIGPERCLFVGLKSEHETFRRQFRMAPEYRQTRDLLELARVIAGAECFVGNQSCPFWIAAGLGVPLIQETWPQRPDSVVPRGNALYTPTWRDAKLLLYKPLPASDVQRVA